MDIRQLRYFLEIVEQGSLTRAAERLHVAQPALSLHLKNMEQQLGTQLVTRHRSGVAVTEAGELLLARARTILDDLARAEDDVRNLKADPSGTVRVGLPGTISSLISLPLVLAARDRYPRITLNIAEAMSGFIGDWLADGRVDIAVLYDRSSDRRIVSEILLEEELIVLRKSAEDGPSEFALADLEDLPMVLPSPAHGLRKLIDRTFLACGLSPVTAIEIDSFANIKQLVAAGFGASILPFYAVRQEVQSGELNVSRIAEPGLWRSAHLMYPAERSLPRAQEVVRDLLREVVLELLDSGAWAGARASAAPEHG